MSSKVQELFQSLPSTRERILPVIFTIKSCDLSQTCLRQRGSADLPTNCLCGHSAVAADKFQFSSELVYTQCLVIADILELGHAGQIACVVLTPEAGSDFTGISFFTSQFHNDLCVSQSSTVPVPIIMSGSQASCIDPIPPYKLLALTPSSPPPPFHYHCKHEGVTWAC